jgi:peroxiredoxin
MRRTLFVLVVSSILVSCKDRSSGKTFTVKGTIINSAAKKIYLEELTPATMFREIVDSAEIGKSGSFSLKTSTENENIYNLKLDEDPVQVVSLINDAAAIRVNIDLMNKTDRYTVEGSENSSKIKELITGGTMKLNHLNRLYFEVDSLQKAKTPDSLLNRINIEGQSAVNDLKEYAGNFIKNSANPVFTLFVLGSFKSFFTMEEYGEFLNNAATKFPGNQSLIVAKQMFDDQKAASKITEIPQETSWVGKKAPEFSLPDANGNQIKLSSFHGKYVLVDFWASWCSPCRMENPNVVKAWSKFKNKNFTILGVSLDRPGQKDNWLNAIKDDNLAWNHVSDLNYWNSEVVSLYKISGIPYNILVDPGGTIIGEKLFGTQLEEKLAEVLK